jgi:3-oxoacyl-[acyl-carrier-protein] synthase II
MQQRIVVTGIGVVTSVGTGREPFWRSLLAGRSGFSPVESFDTTGYKADRGAEIKAFSPAEHIANLDPAHMGRASQLAIVAARLAIADASLDLHAIEPERAGVSIGTTSGEPREIERFDDHFVSEALERSGPEFMALYPCHVIAAHVATELRFAGVNMTIPTACAAGNYAIAHAFDMLRSGRAEVMLAGGSDAFSRITYAGFARLGAIAPDVCQPFDRNRKGMIPGEGAAILVLEPYPRALERGARIYAEVAGYGLSCDAHHMTAAHPQGDGAARAMEKALLHAAVTPAEVGYISAHGTGTPTNDLCETIAVKRVFKDTAYRIPISSIKSMIGHTMGAASAIEAAVCALAIFDDRIPPTMHLEDPDPECDLDYVPNEAREHRVHVAMNNAYAFGGNNSSLILKTCEA